MKSKLSLPENTDSNQKIREFSGDHKSSFGQNSPVNGKLIRGSKNNQNHMISFYGNSNSLQQIQLVKNSIASAFLSNESSLSPFIQAYLKQSLNLDTPQSKSKQLQSSLRNDSNNSIQLPRSTIHHQQRAKTTMDARGSPELARVFQNNPMNKLILSPQKIKQTFIQDKLARMSDISGDVKIGKDLEIMRRRISSAQAQGMSLYQDDYLQDERKNYSVSFYEEQGQHNLLKQNKMENDLAQSDGEDEDRSFSRKQETMSNRFRTTLNPRYKERTMTSESPRQKGRQNHSFQALFQFPQSLEQDIPLIQKKTMTNSSDPNNNMLNKYFNLVQNVNQDNLFVNSIGISEEQKKKIIENMQPDLRSSVQQTFAVKNQISKSTKAAMNGKVDFTKLFQNSREFITDQPAIQAQLHRQPWLGKQNKQEKIKKRDLTINTQLQLDSDKVASSFKSMTNPSFGKQGSCLYSLLSQQKSTKKEYPLYINRVNRIRNRAEEFSSENKPANKQNKNIAHSPSKNSKETEIMIDPRFIYRRNLEIMQRSSSSKNRFNQFEESSNQETQNTFKNTLHHSLIYSDLDVKGLPL